MSGEGPLSTERPRTRSPFLASGAAVAFSQRGGTHNDEDVGGVDLPNFVQSLIRCSAESDEKETVSVLANLRESISIETVLLQTFPPLPVVSCDSS